jgi:hypothetical protein
MVGWRRGATVYWALLGFVVGLGLWTHLLFAVPASVALLALTVRFPAIGLRDAARGVAIAAVGFVAGFSPWLAFNVTHHFLSLSAFPVYRLPRSTGIARFYDTALPVFMGTINVLEPAITLALLAVLVPIALRHRPRIDTTPRSLLHKLQPLDAVIPLLAVIVALVTVTKFNGVYVEPRYFMPAVVPLAVLMALAMRRPWRWRLVAIGVLTTFLVSNVILMVQRYSSPAVFATFGGVTAVQNWEADGRWLADQHPEAVFADYWLERPLQYVTHESIPMAPYDGFLAFHEAAAAANRAQHPDYMFVAGDDRINAFKDACARRGITYTVIAHNSELLFHRLSAPLHPTDLGWAAG